MKIYYSPKFAKEYRKLPLKIKLLAEKKEEIFRNYPFDLRLKTVKISEKYRKLWAFSIGHGYKIVLEFTKIDTARFHTVGIYEF